MFFFSGEFFWFCCSAALVRCNSHTIQFIHFIWWFSDYSQGCANIFIKIFEYYFKCYLKNINSILQQKREEMFLWNPFKWYFRNYYISTFYVWFLNICFQLSSMWFWFYSLNNNWVFLIIFSTSNYQNPGENKHSSIQPLEGKYCCKHQIKHSYDNCKCWRFTLFHLIYLL
jgi:hypothetical protein